MSKVGYVPEDVPTMKQPKKKTKHRPKQKTDRTAEPGPKVQDRNRRAALTRLRNWGILCVVAGAGAWYLVQDVTATMAEHDLSRIGNGVPSVVQIHDQSCNACLALQREARDAMGDFDDSELQYLVADLKSPAGKKLAAAHGVSHVTLLLFDGDGQRRKVLAGPSTSEILGHYFRSHATRYRAKQ